MRTLASGSHDGQIILFGNKLDSGNDNVEKGDDDDDLPCARMQYATAARVIGSEIAAEKGGLAQCKIRPTLRKKRHMFSSYNPPPCAVQIITHVHCKVQKMRLEECKILPTFITNYDAGA